MCYVPVCAPDQLMFLMLIVSAVFNVIKGALSSGNKNKSQDW